MIFQGQVFEILSLILLEKQIDIEILVDQW